MKLKGVFAPYFAVAIRFVFLLLIYALLRLGFYGINASLFPMSMPVSFWLCLPVAYALTLWHSSI